MEVGGERKEKMKTEKLLAEMNRQGINKTQLSFISRISAPDLYSAFNGNKPFYPGWRKRIAEALGVDETEIFDDESMSYNHKDRIKELETGLKDILCMVVRNEDTIRMSTEDWQRFGEVGLMLTNNDDYVSEMASILAGGLEDD